MGDIETLTCERCNKFVKNLWLLPLPDGSFRGYQICETPNRTATSNSVCININKRDISDKKIHLKTKGGKKKSVKLDGFTVPMFGDEPQELAAEPKVEKTFSRFSSANDCASCGNTSLVWVNDGGSEPPRRMIRVADCGMEPEDGHCSDLKRRRKI